MSEFVVNITNIPSQVDEYSLEQVMGSFGKVKSCKILYGNSDNEPAKAWIEYTNEADLQSSLKANGKLDCGGCVLSIKKWTGDIPDDNKVNVVKESKRNFTETSTCQDSCWFCLSNHKCETHMISFISKHAYIAVSKGGLCELHTIVTPIYHFINTAFAPRDVQVDLQMLVDVLMDIGVSEGKGVLAFERYVPMNMKIAMHTQIQVICVPIDKALMCFDYVDNCNKFNARKINLSINEDSSFNCLSSRITNVNQSYFYMQALGHSLREKEKRIAYSRCLWIIEDKSRIPINFGREIAVNLMSDEDLLKLNVSNKYEALDWHNCITSKDEEMKNAKYIRDLILNLT